MQSETKLDGSLKTLVQTKVDTNNYEDLNLVCKSQRGGLNLPLLNIDATRV